MGGLDWQALPMVADMLGVDDIEMFVELLMTLRDNQDRF